MRSTNMLLAGLLVPCLITGCLIRTGHRDNDVYSAPPLPALVILETEPYYVQGGYHYHYQNNGWYYARTRNGPWSNLPRDRYPKEVRFKEGGHGRDEGRTPGHKGK